MKQYVIDELRPNDHQEIQSYLDQHIGSAELEGLYRIPLGPQVLRQIQISHEACGPFFFAIELSPDRLCAELLIRATHTLRCSCIELADKCQRDWIITYVDALLERLEIQI